MFELSVAVSDHSLEAIKADLTRTIPHVKSGHRCEAIGRGLGFSTYAAARSATKTQTLVGLQPRGADFVAYLKEHGFSVSARALYHAVAKVMLHQIVEETPQLTIWGVGVGQPLKTDSGRWEDHKEFVERFRRHRRELVSDAAVAPFLASLALLARVIPTKTIRNGTGSYRLKHIAENYKCAYPEGERLGPIYVPNGAFIAAAIAAGFRFKTYIDDRGYTEVNVSFNMQKRSLNDLDCEIRPDGVRAQAKRRALEERRMYGRSVTFA